MELSVVSQEQWWMRVAHGCAFKLLPWGMVSTHRCRIESGGKPSRAVLYGNAIARSSAARASQLDTVHEVSEEDFMCGHSRAENMRRAAKGKVCAVNLVKGKLPLQRTAQCAQSS
eukprot:3133826-Amphidinium_carterae.1